MLPDISIKTTKHLLRIPSTHRRPPGPPVPKYLLPLIQTSKLQDMDARAFVDLGSATSPNRYSHGSAVTGRVDIYSLVWQVEDKTLNDEVVPQKATGMVIDGEKEGLFYQGRAT